MRFASKGQPRASASRNSCALSPALSPRSTQTRTRGGDSLGGPSASPTLTAIFTAFPVFFKVMVKNSSLLTNHERKYNPDFEPRSRPLLKQRRASIGHCIVVWALWTYRKRPVPRAPCEVRPLIARQTWAHPVTGRRRDPTHDHRGLG